VTRHVDVARLERSLNWALRNSLPHQELVRMLRPLVRATSVANEQGRSARLQLAEHLLLAPPTPSAAWHAALLARAVLAHATELEQRRRAFGAAGLAWTLLGQYRAARTAYLQALAIDPSDPVCAHNLGHLEAVVFDAPGRGLRWLRTAQAGLPEDPEVAASLAHALLKTGDEARARRVLEKALGDPELARTRLQRWAAELQAQSGRTLSPVR
jgi:tetratricopeptide (TPR) repeat protein